MNRHGIYVKAHRPDPTRYIIIFDRQDWKHNLLVGELKMRKAKCHLWSHSCFRACLIVAPLSSWNWWTAPLCYLPGQHPTSFTGLMLNCDWTRLHYRTVLLPIHLSITDCCQFHHVHVNVQGKPCVSIASWSLCDCLSWLLMPRSTNVGNRKIPELRSEDLIISHMGEFLLNKTLTLKNKWYRSWAL